MIDIYAFEKNLCIVEIENSSFCNRKCSYCSNFYLERDRKNEIMPRSLFEKIIDELASFGYSREITFHRYNEPFYEQNSMILERISYARKSLPNAILETSSNGDYLDANYLQKIRNSGLDNLYVQCHVENFSILSREEVHKRILSVNEKIGDFKGKFFDSKKKAVFVTVESGFKILSIQAEDFSEEGFTRGEIVKTVNKKKIEGPCYQPLISMTIDFNGSVTMCSNTLSYYEKHKEYILGNVAERTLKELYFSEKAVKYRSKLLNSERQWICEHCCAHYKNRAEKNGVIGER